MQICPDSISAKVNGVLTPILGVQITVTDITTGKPAALYSDNGVTPLAQPLTTDETGSFAFYAANGKYRLDFASPQIRLAPRMVQLYDPADDAPFTQQQAAASSGASKIGIGAETVENALNALQLADYAALRAYTGPRKSAYVTGYRATSVPSGISGMFVRDDSDTVSADNGGTVIVSANGTRWKRQYSSEINILWFGADPTFTNDSTAAVQAAIVAGNWDGTSIFAPNGTYAIDGTIYVGTLGATTYHAVTLRGESTYGTVFRRRTGKTSGAIFAVDGHHHKLGTFQLMSDIDASGYAAGIALYVRGYPQPGALSGTKWCEFDDIHILQAGTAVQVGNYDVDGKDPDIETNAFRRIKWACVNTGLYLNGQNILHNRFELLHMTDARDYLIHQKRGGDLMLHNSYIGPMYDKLTNSYNPASTKKIFIEAGNARITESRSEDYATAAGNTTARYALLVSSTDSHVSLRDNTFTTRDNLSTEPSVKFSGVGGGGAAAVKIEMENNRFDGYVEIDTVDVFDIGSTFSGTASGGNGVVNGRLLSANQKNQSFKDAFVSSNQTPELPGAKFKRNSSVPVTFERVPVANTSEWQGFQHSDDAGTVWGRLGLRTTNATAGKEGAAHLIAARADGAFKQINIGLGSTAPLTGVWNANDRIFTTAAAVGSPKGWINTATGGASSTTRADATAYAAGVWAKWPTSTTVWECTTAGTSTTGAPDITGKAVGQTVTDGTVVWTMRATTQANFVSEGNL